MVYEADAMWVFQHLSQRSVSWPNIIFSQLVDRCFICESEIESIDHILLHCSKGRELWHLLFSLLGVVLVLFFTVRESLLNWHNLILGRKQRKVWSPTLLYIFWTLWKERIQRTFEMKNNQLSHWRAPLLKVGHVGLECT